jgi:hypothetical protein
MRSDWRCDGCGPVTPLHIPVHIGPEVMAVAVSEVARHRERVPLWCPWPMPLGWTVSGVGWAGDEREGIRATVLAATGPAPLTGGPADLLVVAEAPGVGLASRLAGLSGPDPGPLLAEAMSGSPAHAKVRAGRHPAPLWSVRSAEGRSAYVGEARGVWLVGIAWPATAGYLFADELALRDLVDWLPPELVYGAPSARLPG